MEVDYYGFGGALVGIGVQRTEDRNLYQFQGKEREMAFDANIYDFHARQYDPQLGRFMQVDPADQFASGYTGMGNNPVMGIDPNGEFVITTAIIIGVAIVGAAFNVASNWDDISSSSGWSAFGKIVGYAGIGAGSGVLALYNPVAAGAALGGANALMREAPLEQVIIQAAVGGAAAYAGAAVGGKVAGALAGKNLSGFLGGFISGAAGGGAAGFLYGSLGTWFGGGSFEDGFKNGFRSGLIGGLLAGTFQGVAQGISALKNPNIDLDGNASSRNFWSGRDRASGRGAFSLNNSPKTSIHVNNAQKVVSPKTVSEFASDYNLRASQPGVVKAKVQEYYNKMKTGNFDPTLKKNMVGGFTKNGNYIIGEGHHRVAAAIAYGMRTGNYTILESLIRGGLWTRNPNYKITQNAFPKTWK